MQDGTYAIYLRKSREDIEAEKYGEGETLARHEKILTTLAKKRKLHISKIYREVVSGETISERKEMQKLLRDVENEKWTGVLVVEVERLARGDTADQGRVSKAFKYSHTKIITPVKTYDPDNEFDEEYFEFGLFMSRREYKTINRRLQRGRELSVSEGKFVGNIAPFGYDRVKLKDAKGYTLSINQDEAPVVKEIFRLYAFENATINSVAKQLNKLNLKPRIANKWSISSVKDILSNPTYIGKIAWNRRKQKKKTKNGHLIISRPRNQDYLIYDGLHEPIIDNKTFIKQKLNDKLLAIQKKSNSGYIGSYINPKSTNDINVLCIVDSMFAFYNMPELFAQTFKIVEIGFMLVLFHKQKSADDMLKGMDWLDNLLSPLRGVYSFILLTDRGSEFVKADEIEFRKDGSKRFNLFYCDPMCSHQKGSLENNHEELRYILPKETDLYSIGFNSQEKANLITSNINSVKKEKLKGKTPFELLTFYYPQIVAELSKAGIHEVDRDKVNLTPSLIK